MRNYFVLILGVPALAVFGAIVLGAWDQFVAFLPVLWTCSKVIAILWVILKVLGFFFRSPETADTEDRPLHSYDAFRAIPDANVSRIDDVTFRLDARGRSFLVKKGKSGRIAAREIEPNSGKYISDPMHGSEKDMAGENASLAKLLRYKINEGR